MKQRSFWVWLALSVTGCGGDFTPYQEIDRLRVLAVGADRPWLRFSETASISALVVQASADRSPISYEWSWCPLTAGNDRAYECAFTEAEIQAQIDAAVGPGVLEVPPFALGTTSSVTFSYGLTPLLFRGLCDALSMQELPDFVAVPECAGTFPITIRLVAGDGDEEVIAIRELELIYDDSITEVNTNPIILGVGAGSATIALDAMELERDADIPLMLDVPSTSIERVGERSEQIVVSWFVDAGELERTRTAFIEGEVDTLRENVWHTPRTPDWPETSARLFFVIRDDRRGISWIERSVTLKETP